MKKFVKEFSKVVSGRKEESLAGEWLIFPCDKDGRRVKCACEGRWDGVAEGKGNKIDHFLQFPEEEPFYTLSLIT